MHIDPVDIPGAYLFEPEATRDDRGYFARTFCRREMSAIGVAIEIVQCNVSYNVTRGTLRGLHFQKAPHAEGKIVRCIRGSMYDVIVDLRPDSPSYCRWQAFELDERNGYSLYIPPGIAHGFQTLSDGTEVSYMMTEFHHPESADGVRWNDPAFSIEWPIGYPIISERDSKFPDFKR